MGIDCLWEADDEEQLSSKLEEISLSPAILPLRLALFLSLFVPESGMLRLSKEESQLVDFLCKEPCLAWENQGHFHKMIAKHGRDKMNLLFFYQKCQFPYHLRQLDALEVQLAEKNCTSLTELAINGHDLKEKGVAPGEMVGKLLKIALNLVLDGTVENEKEALLSVIFGEEKPETPLSQEERPTIPLNIPKSKAPPGKIAITCQDLREHGVLTVGMMDQFLLHAQNLVNDGTVLNEKEAILSVMFPEKQGEEILEPRKES